MANPEHLKILEKGVSVWNKWRDEKPDIAPNLSGANLHGADLIEANLRKADLSGANLHRAVLIAANLIESDLIAANLREADLTGAKLWVAHLESADFSGAKLIQAILRHANLKRANLVEADLSRCVIGRTIFADVDLSNVKGLDTIRHDYPSTIGLDTIYRSKGKIPEAFLRGAGVPENFIEYMSSLAGEALEFYSCFISYSSKDEEFAKRLHADLQSENIRCWFYPENIKTGDKIRTTIHDTIRVYDKLLIVLSEDSIESDWVEKEVETAFEEESKRKKTILFPLRLDDTALETNKAWAADIRTRHISDFTKWKDHDFYKKSFQRLVRDLKKSEEIK